MKSKKIVKKFVRVLFLLIQAVSNIMYVRNKINHDSNTFCYVMAHNESFSCNTVASNDIFQRH